jgi:hypothetical protein
MVVRISNENMVELLIPGFEAGDFYFRAGILVRPVIAKTNPRNEDFDEARPNGFSRAGKLRTAFMRLLRSARNDVTSKTFALLGLLALGFNLK